MSNRCCLLCLVMSLQAPSMSHAANRPEMVHIPSGSFIMGYAPSIPSRPEHKVHVDAFFIDKYEVTQGAEVLSNVVDEIFGGHILCPRWASRSGAASRGTSIFSSTQPPKPDWLRDVSAAAVPGLPPIWLRLGGDKIETSAPKATPFGLSWCSEKDASSSSDLLDSIHEFHAPNHLGEQLLAVDPTPVFLRTLGQLENHRQASGTAPAALGPHRTQSHRRER